MAELNLSAFDVIGPTMIGPSSSHTAGAARIGLIARRLFGGEPHAARVHLHGSFWATGRGHATDRAIVCGLLGWPPDDTRLPRALECAAAQKILVSFHPADFGDTAHPNTARVELMAADSAMTMTARSLGGGIIEVIEVDGYPTSFYGDHDTIVCWHADERGFLAQVTAICADVGINIASLRTARAQRGGPALTVIESDSAFESEILARLRQVPSLEAVKCLGSIR